MNRHIKHTAWMVMLLAATVGCSGSSDTGGSQDMDDMAAMLNQPKTVPADSAPPAESTAEEEPVEYTQAVEVTAKDPKKGKVFHGQGGYLNAVFSARFYAEHRLTLDKVKHATDLFEATNSRMPNSHEEFMTEIIEANYIELPELDDGYEYWYDPSDGVLKMRKPIVENGELPNDE